MSALPPESPATNNVPSESDGGSAHERLTQSRERISVWLTDENRGAGSPDHAGGGAASSQDERPNPVAAIAIEVLTEWWRSHPLQATANLAGAAARQAIVPLVRRYPAAVLGAAAVAGALLVRTRAWRWVLRPAVVVGVASQIAARIMSRMATDPVPGDPPAVDTIRSQP